MTPAQSGRAVFVDKNAGATMLRRGTMKQYRRYGIQVCAQNQIEAQRSGFDLERRSDGVNER